jgi:hypothetical protein
MYKKSLQRCTILINQNSMFGCRPINLLWIASLYSLFSSVICWAEMPIVTLSQLIGRSEVIVYGRLDPRLTPAGELVSFRADSILKGGSLVSPGSISLCNPSDHSEEAPDLSKIQGNVVIFLKEHSSCLRLSYGAKSIVDTRDGRANTSAIDGELASQPLNHFLSRIREIAKTPSNH